MIKEVDEVIKHAVMAAHDREIRSIAIVMIAKGNAETGCETHPEVHMAVCSDDVWIMNGAADMFKLEMTKMLNIRAGDKKPRE